MALRKTTQTAAAPAVEQSNADDTQELKVNPEIDKKIDEFIKNNPAQFDYYSSLPRERLVRVAILKDIQGRERSERTKNAILRKLEADPEMKKSVETLVRNLPEDRKRTAMANIASRTFRMQARSAQQKPGGEGTSIRPTA
jgi:hypothetical protein